MIKDEFIPPGNLYENKRATAAPGLLLRKEEREMEGEREVECIIQMINYVCETIMSEWRRRKGGESAHCDMKLKPQLDVSQLVFAGTHSERNKTETCLFLI